MLQIKKENTTIKLAKMISSIILILFISINCDLVFSEKPNIIIIMADDMVRWKLFSCRCLKYLASNYILLLKAN